MLESPSTYFPFALKMALMLLLSTELFTSAQLFCKGVPKTRASTSAEMQYCRGKKNMQFMCLK